MARTSVQQPLWRVLRGQVSRARPAVTFGETTRTYGELTDRSLRLLSWLRFAELDKGDRVAILMRNNADWFDLVFACAAGGYVYVPLDYSLRPAEILRIVRDCEPKVLVFDQHSDEAAGFCKQERTSVSHYLCVGDEKPWAESFDAVLSAALAGGPDEDVGDDDLFLIQYTSGTTGLPRGVMHTHSTVVWNTIHQMGDFRVGPDERWLCIPSLCWVAGLHDVTLATLWAGGHVFLRPSGGLQAPEVLDEIETWGITKTVLVPTVLRRVVQVLEEQPRELPTLESVITGGESIPVSLIERFHAVLPHLDVVQAYGLSEFPCAAAILPPGLSVRKAGSAGLPSSITDIRVVNDEGEDLAVGAVGEVAIKSPATTIGYWHNSEATMSALRGGWLFTGDAGRWDEDGFLYITGRKKDMYISGGLNVYPAEVEDAISRHPGVAEVAIVGVPNEEWGEVGVAIIVPREGAQLDVSELQEFCRQGLASFKIPKRWVFSYESLPRTNSGKIMKSALRDTMAPS